MSKSNSFKAEESHRGKRFHLEFLNTSQKLAWAGFQQHDVLFLAGPAGCGKTYLSVAFAVSEVLQKTKKRIVMTRPIVESGESLGYLPGDFMEKTNPYMQPMYDCLGKLIGWEGDQFNEIHKAVEIAPIAYMRGRSFDDAICIFDEAQNATLAQLRLFLTRFGKNSKLIVNGDPEQSDIGASSGFVEVMQRLETVPGIGSIRFKRESIVRHPLVGKILERLTE